MLFRSDLLRQGFTGVKNKVASKPAKHFRSALGQVVNFFYTLQGEAAGAQAFSDFDTLLTKAKIFSLKNVGFCPTKHFVLFRTLNTILLVTILKTASPHFSEKYRIFILKLVAIKRKLWAYFPAFRRLTQARTLLRDRKSVV